MRRSILILILALVPAIRVIAADCNGNGIDDSLETLIRAGDYDYDADVDADDFAALAANLAGPGEPLPDPPCATMLLGAFDADTDGDLDLLDFAAFQGNFTGPHEPEGYLRYATGWPDHVEWVDYGWLMTGYFETGPALWGTSAFEFTVAEPTMITSLAGVGGGFSINFPGTTPYINIHSDLNAFAATPLVGDVKNIESALSTTTPPPFGIAGQGEGWQNFYHEYSLNPLVLTPGTYILSVYHYSNVDYFHAESAVDFDRSAWLAHHNSKPGVIKEYTSHFGYATGTVAIDIKGYPAP